jgi:diguanylate cyclase (GGDEF)-like protein/PAS domain S-box-containing protein
MGGLKTAIKVGTHPSAAAKVLIIVAVFGLIALLLEGMIYLQGDIHDGIRAYVHGEGVWAKAQQEAVISLDRFASSRDEADYRDFRAAIDVTLGDRQARLALSADPPDEPAARAGFLRGRNRPEDVESMVWFYRRFASVSYMHQAIDSWRRGDEKIDELIRSGEAMHSLAAGADGDAAMIRLRPEVRRLNAELLDLENQFSDTLGEGARWVRRTFWYASLVLLAACLGVGVSVSRQIIRGIVRNEEQLRLAATVFASGSDGILITDADLRIVSVNQALCDRTGWSAAELEGKTPRIFHSGHTPAETYRDMWTALTGGRSWQGDVIDRTRDGSLLPLRVSVSGVRGAHGQVTHYVCVMMDISERKAQEEELRYLAHHDALTGLPNRVLFDDRLRQAVKNALRNDRRFAVLFFDLDRFKAVNDRHGHEVGDKVLQRVAERLTAQIRGTDTVTRLGGDEFAMLLVDVESRPYVENVLRKVVASVCEPFDVDALSIEIGISVGMALFPDDGSSAEELMRLADQAMYRMKTGDEARRK